MNLYFLRHGASEPPSRWKGSDRERPLTDAGENEVTSVGRAIRGLGIEFDAVFSSPFVRTMATAERVVAEQAAAVDVTTCDGLVVYGDGAAVIRDVNADGKPPACVLLVGHEPILCEIVSMLVSGTIEGSFRIVPGALGRLSTKELRWGQCATLDWILEPDHLRELAEQASGGE